MHQAMPDNDISEVQEVRSAVFIMQSVDVQQGDGFVRPRRKSVEHLRMIETCFLSFGCSLVVLDIALGTFF